ncbi:MAG: DUF4157 domain-containing protein [Alphaproteobacteria bacterium]|nr:DUF4157 domain-containing protein [Alphaproteobacteria bacterium]
MEPRFGADFSQVRVHTDDRAARLNRQLSARAFTYGNHVFFGGGEYQPQTAGGMRLIAHELTHTLQQTAGPARRPLGVQRLGISDALDYFADKAYLIPGYRLFTLVIGVNPINMAKVPRTAANLLRALVELIPGGNLLVRVLDKYSVFDKAGAWIAQRFAALGLSGASVRADLMRFLKSLGWRDIFRLGSVWTRAKQVFLGPIQKLLTLAAGLGAKLLDMIRGAVLEPLAKLASKTKGYPLLKALLGRDPITGKASPRTPAAVIGGLMTLIGQEELWKNIVKAKAVPRAWAWFQGAVKGLLSILTQAPAKFIAALKSLTLTDFLILPKAFIKLGGVFVSLIGQVLRWGGQTVWTLLEIVFDVVAPGLRAKLAKAKGALRSILKDPIGFLRNLLRAGKLGFNNFVKGFVGHLKGALIGWLTGNLGGAGVHIPKALSFKEILPFVLDVLGLGWAALRQRLVKAVGETAVKAMEGGFTLIKTLITKGPAGVWQQLKQSLGNLKDTVLNGIIDFVQGSVVKKAVFKLLSMLSPVGAFIQSIIAIYDTVMFFVERLSQIGQLLSAVLGSLAAIAAGKVMPAARKVEQALATSLTLVISFLARFVGLGGIGKALKKIIEKVRKPVGKALDKVVKWIVAKARKLGKWVAQIGAPKDPMKRLKAAGKAAVKAAKTLKGKLSKAALKPLLAVIRARYGLKSLTPMQEAGKWVVLGKINPDWKQELMAGEGGLNQMVYEALVLLNKELMDDRKRLVKENPSGSSDYKKQFHIALQKAQDEYKKARETHSNKVEDATFAFLGHKFFVTRDVNYYVVPWVEAEPLLDKPNVSKLIEELAEKYAYNKTPLTFKHHRDIVNHMMFGGHKPVRDSITMFLAIMVAEAHRNPISNIVNMLILGSNRDKGPELVKDKTPMARGGSDNPNATRDKSLQKVTLWELAPIKVTGMELELSKTLYIENGGKDLRKEHLVRFAYFYLDKKFKRSYVEGAAPGFKSYEAHRDVIVERIQAKLRDVVNNAL